MKTFISTLALTVMFLSAPAVVLTTPAFAGNLEHCVARIVTSNDNSLQGYSKVCDAPGNSYQKPVKEKDCDTKR